MITDAIQRVVFGPEPPVGVVYTPARTIRCRLGLHRWADVWESQIVSQSTDGLGTYTEVRSFNLDREPDYAECVRCGTMRHIEREPML